MGSSQHSTLDSQSGKHGLCLTVHQITVHANWFAWKQEHPQRPSQLWFFCIAMFVVFLGFLMFKAANQCCVLDFKGWFPKNSIPFWFSGFILQSLGSFCIFSGGHASALVKDRQRQWLSYRIMCHIQADDARYDVNETRFNSSQQIDTPGERCCVFFSTLT